MKNDDPKIPPNPSARSWVWRCSDKSIEAGHISALAVAEVFAAIALYWWLATHFDRLWMAFVALFAAPILLLRSPESVELGVAMLERYWNREEERLTRWKKVVIILISTLSAAVLVGCWFPASWLPGYAGWALFWRAAVIGAVAVAVAVVIAGAVAIVAAGPGQNAADSADTAAGAGAAASAIVVAIAIAIAGPVAGVIAGVIAVTIVGAVAIVNVGPDLDLVDADEAAGAGAGMAAGAIVVAIAGAIAGVVAGTGAGVGVVVVAIAIAIAASNKVAKTFWFFAPVLVLGVLLRALFIRWFATLRHLPAGLARLPQNWRETLLVIDPLHPPELLPQAGGVDNGFTVRGLWDDMSNLNGPDKLFQLIILLAWYLPALAYRWSLKASAWLWWPLALALTSPLEGLDGQTSRERTALSVGGAWRLLLLLVSSVVFAWLILSVFPGLASLLHILHNGTAVFAQELLAWVSPPPLGVRYVTLWLGCVLALVFWWLTKNLRASHGKVLESPKEFNDLPDVDKARFLQLARPIARLRLLLIVTLIVLGYSFALFLFHSVDPQLAERFIAPWLLRVL